MKRAYLFSSLGLVGLVGVTGAVIQVVDRQLPERASVGQVPVGGSNAEEAAKKLRIWWEGEKTKKLTLKLRGKETVAELTPSQLGLVLDDAATIAQVPEAGKLTQAIQGDVSESKYPLVFKRIPVDFVPLGKKVAALLPPPTPARVKFSKGAILLKKEGERKSLDSAAIGDLALKALTEGKQEFNVPLKTEPKKITDEMVAGIKDVIGEFSTRFSAGNRPRSANIKLAASKLDGVILLPGETVSFNGTVGRRTMKAGFKMAGVYLNGRHDTGIGGGICQVSTTLYNAALFADMGIVDRQNHSMPVPYVPVGRDATVDYGNIDLVLKNTMPDPIVLAADYQPGKLTFRVLGTKRDDFKVRIVANGTSYRGGRERRVVDRSLPPGVTRVVERGSSVIITSTVRVVERNGVVRRDPVEPSHYSGGIRIVAYNPSRPRPKAPAPRATPAAPTLVEEAPEPTSSESAPLSVG